MLGPKMHSPFLQRCIKGFVFLGLVWVLVFGVFFWFYSWAMATCWVFLGCLWDLCWATLCILSCILRGVLRFF